MFHNRIGRRALLAGLAGACLGSVLPRPGAAASYGIRGKPAPELTLDDWIDADGEPTSFRLAPHRGKWVFLKCFQSWCPGCHSHGFPALAKLLTAFSDEPRVVFAGIQTVFEGFSTNTRGEVRALQLRYRLPIVMGHDPGDPEGDHRPSTMRLYRTGGTPWMILIEPGGRVVYNHYSVDVERAVAYLNQRLAEPADA